MTLWSIVLAAPALGAGTYLAVRFLRHGGRRETTLANDSTVPLPVVVAEIVHRGAHESSPTLRSLGVSVHPELDLPHVPAALVRELSLSDEAEVVADMSLFNARLDEALAAFRTNLTTPMATVERDLMDADPGDELRRWRIESPTGEYPMIVITPHARMAEAMLES